MGEMQMGREETTIVAANADKNKIPYPHFISPCPGETKGDNTDACGSLRVTRFLIDSRVPEGGDCG
jgi:hypothetical protein